MISSDKAKEFLQSKKIENLTEKRVKALSKLLKKDEERLGLLLIDQAEEYKQEDDEYSSDKEEKRNLEIRLMLFCETEGKCIWETEFKHVLPALFGDLSPYIIAAWKNINSLMYQTGYYRRSFRAPNSPVLFIKRKMDWLESLIGELKYELSLPEYAQYIGYIYSYGHLAITHIFAAAIQANDDVGQAVKKVIIDTIYGKDKIGKMSRPVIKSLLMTDVHENHVVIEKLLLSAQRQEGLRQSILESLDETSLSAQIHLMKVILEHDLLRFSSVVRALDVWAGMQWESAKIASIKRSLQLGFDYISNPKTIDAALNSMDNLEIYMALWASASLSIEDTIPRIETVLKRKEAEKKATALFFLNHIQRPDTQTELALPFIDSKNLFITTFAFTNIISTEEDKSKTFKLLVDLWQNIGAKEYTVEGKIFSWTHRKLTRYQVMDRAFRFCEYTDFHILEPLYDDMEADNRRDMANRFLFPEEEKERTPEIRVFIFKVLTDRSEWVRTYAFKALENTKILPEESVNVESLLGRKSADLRKGVLSLLFKQDEKEIFGSTERLLNSGKIQQRLGGLDLLNQLHQNKINPNKVQELASIYKERKKLSDKELIILSNLNPDTEEYNAANGFGLYNPQNLTLSPAPVDNFNAGDISDVKEGDGRHPYDFDLARLASILEELLQLFKVHEDHEYELEEWDRTMSKQLIGGCSINRRHQYSKADKDLSPREVLEDFPLHELWEKWYKESNFTPKELWLFNTFARPSWGYNYGRKADFLKPLKAFFKPHIPHKIYKTEEYQEIWSAINIVTALSDVYPFEGQIDFVHKTTESLLSHIPEDQIVFKKDDNFYYTWRDSDPVNYWIAKTEQDVKKMNKSQLAKAWHLSNWFFRSAKYDEKRGSRDWRVGIELNVAAYKQAVINQDDFTESILFGMDDLRSLTTKNKERKSEYQEDEEVMRIVYKCVNRVLDVELKRGDTGTPLTPQVTKFQSIYGIDRLVEILSALKKDNLQKGYVYSGGQTSKKESFSHLLRVSYPNKEETFTDFSAAIKKAKISEQRILEVAMYSPQWLPMVQEFLGWKKLTDAVWWFHAHTKESGYQADDRWTADVNTYTSLSPTELSDGAVDVQWFKAVYQGLKKARWEKLYTAAKYISTGPGYRRAQIFADAMLGNFKIKALTDEIADKRNQDKLRAFGLVPLNKRNAEADILKRYKFLQGFLKESKQFGSQRQASEKAAVKISMENLARTAAYPDPIRLSWAMEALEAKEILEKSKPFVEKDVEIVLRIDETGMTHLDVTKAGKALKSIPAKLRKNKEVLQLKAYQKTLKEQYRRTRKALEEAMCRGDEFKVSEIDNLFQHPVVAPQLKKIILSNSEGDKTTVGYYEKGNLVVPDKNTFALPEEALLRLAHCTDLHKSGNWSDLQKDCFRNKRVQPFKQIFRELYLPTHDELAEITTSRRYAGHQVQVKKTIALLKTRGWTVDPDSGLRKVYHKENLIVNLFAIADWFTPSDVESPTLETVSFTDRDSHKLVPFKELSPLIFSEVMRDIDLVVSVAHAGGVDPEASHSTIEMRTIMAEETAMLLGFKNVSLKGSHIVIKGTLGSYSVHLGSGVVHKMPGGYLSILPVHSAHRGRIFLPFADDDPKTSEILSKMLLLAEDDKIQDPTVLRQI